MRRELALIATLVLLVGLASPVVSIAASTHTPTPGGPPTPVNQTHTSTATPTATPTPTPTPTPSVKEQVDERSEGPYSIDFLKAPGDSEGVDEVPSVRSLGDPPMGFVAARYRDPTLIDAITGSPGQWRDIEPDFTVQQNRIQLYGSAFGDVAGEYDLVIVYWQEGQTRVNGSQTPVSYVTNQTVDRRQIAIGGGSDLYTFNNVTLRQHLDATWKVTMFLERNGEPVDGVRWRFTHRSNPESSPVSINSQSEAWAFALKSTGIPGFVGVIAGLVLSRVVLRRTGRGPGYGVKSWIFIIGFVSLIVSMVAYYQIAVILDNFPWVMGLGLGVVAFSAGLTIHPEEKRIGFFRRELADAITIPGGSKVPRNPAGDGGLAEVEDAGAEIFDEFTEALKADLPEVPIVKTEKGYRVPVEGVKAFFARLFADAAILNVEGIATREKVDVGRLDDIIYVDPKSKQAMEHKPARFVRVLPWDTIHEDGAEPTSGEKIVAFVMSAIIIAGPPLGGMAAASWLLNLPSLGFLLGVIGTLAIAYSAEDGWIDFVPAPPHYKRAEDSLTLLQRAYAWAADEESYRKEAYRARATTASEAIEQQDEERRTVTDKLLERRGVSRDDGRPELEDGDS